MIVTGLYENSPPATSIFIRAGSATSSKKRNEQPAPRVCAVANEIDRQSKLYEQQTEP